MKTNKGNPESNPQEKSKLDNFRGKRHTFTKEDSIKGGKASSDRKRVSSAFNAMKTGRYSKRVPHCNTCPIKKQCEFYDLEDPTAPCKVLDIPGYRELVFALRMRDEEEMITVINKHMQRLYIKDLKQNDRDAIRDFILLLIKLNNSQYKRRQENVVNIQVNNFHNEFNLFKDTTIKVLKKYPKIMQEWREQLESAKQSD